MAKLRQRQRGHRAPRLDRAAELQGAAAVGRGRGQTRGPVCSTSMIGVPLRHNAIVRALPDMQLLSSPARRRRLHEGISTTERDRKARGLQVELGGGPGAALSQAKGARHDLAPLRHPPVLRESPTPPSTPRLQPVLARPARARSTHQHQPPALDQWCSWPRAPAACHVEPETEDELRLGKALDARCCARYLLLRRATARAPRQVGRVRRRPRRARRSPPPAPWPTPRWSKPALNSSGTRLGRDRPGGGWALPGAAPRWTSPSRACPCYQGGAPVAHDVALRAARGRQGGDTSEVGPCGAKP